VTDNERTDGRTNTHGSNVHRDRRRHAVDVAVTRDKRTDEKNSRRLSVSYMEFDTYTALIAGPSAWNRLPDPVRNPNSCEDVVWP